MHLSGRLIRIVEQDVLTAAGSMQVCAGPDGGCEAAVHAMRDIFNTDDTEGILLVDAANAFNNLNRKAALHNINYISPALATILANTYIGLQPGCLCLVGVRFCRVMTLLGDQLGMAMYALAVIPLAVPVRCPYLLSVSLLIQFIMTKQIIIITCTHAYRGIACITEWTAHFGPKNQGVNAPRSTSRILSAYSCFYFNSCIR